MGFAKDPELTRLVGWFTRSKHLKEIKAAADLVVYSPAHLEQMDKIYAKVQSHTNVLIFRVDATPQVTLLFVGNNLYGGTAGGVLNKLNPLKKKLQSKKSVQPFGETALMRMLANRMKSFRSQLQNQVDANRTQLQENETELARILPLKRHDQDWKWRVADSRAGIRDAKKEIRSLEKHLVAKLDSLTNFQKAIEAVEEEYGQWRINNRSTKKFIVDPKYKFTPAMFKKAWAYANNEPVEGLK